MSDREIRIHRTYFHPDDIHDGDIPRDDFYTETHDDEWIRDKADFMGEWNDDETEWIPAPITVAAAELVEETGCTGPYSYSEHPGFQPGGWYSLPDGSTEADEWDAHYTGRRMEVSVHLDGFTDSELEEIHRIVTSPYGTAV